MKKNFLLAVLLVVFTAFASAQSSSLIKDILRKSAEDKVAVIQKLVQFSDDNARKIEAVEFQFLLDVQKAENCCRCNSAKRTEKLKQKKNDAIANILPRDEFLKYLAIENETVKKYPLRAR